jgi:hypothetical protein
MLLRSTGNQHYSCPRREDPHAPAKPIPFPDRYTCNHKDHNQMVTPNRGRKRYISDHLGPKMDPCTISKTDVVDHGHESTTMVDLVQDCNVGFMPAAECIPASGIDRSHRRWRCQLPRCSASSPLRRDDTSMARAASNLWVGLDLHPWDLETMVAMEMARLQEKEVG